MQLLILYEIVVKVKEIFKNSIWFGIVPKLSYILTLIITPLITPYMSAEDYGIIGIETSYVGLFSGFATLGLHVHLSNSFFSYGDKFSKVWRRLIFWIFLGASFFFALSICFLMIKLPNVDPYSRLLVSILCSIIILTNINSVVAQHYYLNLLTPEPLVFRNFLASVLENLLFFVFVYYLRIGFMGKILSTAISNIFLFILFIPPLWIKLKLYPLPNKFGRRVKHWFKVSLPIIPHTVGHIILSNSDRIVMSVLNIFVADIGLYSHGYSFGNYVSILIDAVTGSMSPVIQKTYRSRNNAQMKKIFLFLQFIAFVVVFFISSWMPEIYKILIRNETLHPAAFIAFFTSFSFLVSPLYSVLSGISFMEEKTTKVLWLVFVPAIVNIILNFILIPYGGYKMAILTTLIAYWGMLAIAEIIPYYRTIVKNWLGGIRVIIFVAIASVILLFLAYALYKTTLWIKIIISSVIVLFAGIFCIKNLKWVKNINFNY